jgi:predicted TIM-barrel fold metal-dependent hydrolase
LTAHRPTLPLPPIDDPEGAWTPGPRGAFDAHVHLFPDRVFEAIWRWFDRHAWPIRYRLRSEQVIEFLASRGVTRMLGLSYAHRPGMAESLNAYVLALARRYKEVLPFATVLPGEDGAREIVRRAIGEGARGVKLHCHVQKLAPDDPRVLTICEELEGTGRPLVMHAGREPSSAAYGMDVRALCSAARVEQLLARFPGLLLVVPHLGADEFDDYESLLARFPNLFLDTTMVVADFFPGPSPMEFVRRHADRVMYGSDFPNIPYAWDRELARLSSALAPGLREQVLEGNAVGLYGRGF